MIKHFGKFAWLVKIEIKFMAGLFASDQTVDYVWLQA